MDFHYPRFPPPIKKADTQRHTIKCLQSGHYQKYTLAQGMEPIPVSKLISSLTLLLLGLLHCTCGVTAITSGGSYLHCNSSIGKCEGEEILMESETARMMLEQRRYISIGALSRDQPACGGGARGQAYSNNAGCLPPPSHPYTRGCSKYYRCSRSDS